MPFSTNELAGFLRAFFFYGFIEVQNVESHRNLTNFIYYFFLCILQNIFINR